MLFARASVPLLLLLVALASARPRLLEHFAEDQHLESHKHRCHYEVAPGSVLHDFGEVSVVEEPDGQRYELPECVATRKYKEQERALAAEFGQDDESVARREISAADGANPNNQWAAWYYAACNIAFDGCKVMSSTWETTDDPDDTSANLALFPGLQPTYDPKPYDFVMQPVSLWGNRWWVNAGYNWGCVATTCATSGNCINSPVFKSGPRHSIYGNITEVTTGLWEIVIMDLNTGESTSVKYSTTYFAAFAFLTLEHTPAGNFARCSQVQVPPYEVTFSNVQVSPNILGVWSGTQNNFDCGVSIDYFPFGPSYTIKL